MISLPLRLSCQKKFIEASGNMLVIPACYEPLAVTQRNCIGQQGHLDNVAGSDVDRTEPVRRRAGWRENVKRETALLTRRDSHVDSFASREQQCLYLSHANLVHDVGGGAFHRATEHRHRKAGQRPDGVETLKYIQ